MEVLLVSETLVHWVGLKVGECVREAEMETEMVLVPREVPLGAFSVCVGEASEPLGEGELVKEALPDTLKETVELGVADVLGEAVSLVQYVGLWVGSKLVGDLEVETEMVLVPREVPLGAFSVCVGEASEPLGEGELVKQPLLDMFKEAVKIGVADVLGELVTLVQYVGLGVRKLVGELVVETVEVVVLLGVPLGSLGVDVGEADPLGVVEEVTLGLFTGVTLGTTVLVDV